MTLKYTPGPWKVAELDQAQVVAPEVAGRPYSIVIAECPGYKEPREANARLIAAAPDLLDTLRLVNELALNALDHAHPRNSASISAIASATRAALAKGGAS